MPVHQLADELLQMILAPPLAIPRQRFISPSSEEFGANDTVSSASIIQVCKRWLQVGTPLLYHTVVIRSTAQSRALATVFRRTPAIAAHVKNIRLEGAFAHLDHVLPRCTNLVTFVLFVEMYPDSNVKTLCKSFPLINPVELILRGNWVRDNAKDCDVFLALCDSIPKWKNLVAFEDLNFGRGSGYVNPGSTVTRSDYLVKTLARSKSLRILSTDRHHITSTLWTELADISSVHFRFHYNSNDLHEHWSRSNHDPKLLKYSFELVDVAERPSYMNKLTKKAIGGLLTQHTFESVDDNIWRKIIKFVTLPAYSDTSNSSDFFRLQVHLLNNARQAISLVCKRFEAIVRPIFFEFPLIFSLAAFGEFTRKIVKTPSLGHLVRVMSLSFIRYSKLDGENEIGTPLRALIPHLVHLLHFDCSWKQHDISTHEVFLLALTTGNTLRTLTGPILLPDQPSSPYLHHFKRLKTLEIGYGRQRKDCALFRSDALPSLHALENLAITYTPYEYCGFRPNFVANMHALERPYFDTPSMTRLPQLKSLSFINVPTTSAERFLRWSQPPVTDLEVTGFADFTSIFKVAPTLLRLKWDPRISTWSDTQSIGEVFTRSTVHAKLQKVTILDIPRLTSKEKYKNTMIESLFDSLDLNNFPSLKEMRFLNYPWPVETRAIFKQVLPKKAVQVKKSHGIDITDKSGRPWRPRAQ